jgi:lactate permease
LIFYGHSKYFNTEYSDKHERNKSVYWYDSSHMDLMIATLPLLLLISLVVFFKKSITFAVSVSLGVLLLSIMYWGTELASVGGASVRGLLLATEIIIVIFSAVLIFEVLERNKLFTIILQLLQKVSKDKILQTLFVLLGVVTFMEGVAGFGTPAIIAIPLLLSIGYTPIQSVILALLADSVPVSFGAIGLPVTFGVGSVLSTIEGVNSEVLLSEVIRQTALINIVGFALLGVLMLVAMKKFLDEKFRIRDYLPIVLCSAILVGVVSFMTAVFIGPELASIAGGIAGMLSVTFLSRLSMFRHKASRLLETEVIGHEHVNKHLLLKAVLPYSILIVLLLLTRIPAFGIGETLGRITLGFESLFGSDVSYETAPLVSAASILLFTALFSLFWYSESVSETKLIVRDVLKTVSLPFIALCVTLVFIQIFVNSASNELAAMPIVIAESLGGFVGEYWIVFSPFIGVLGSFLSGSATVSNLIFTGIQYDVAVETMTDPARVLSMQSIGAALGNMIALHNIVAALAIAKLHNRSTHLIIRQNVKYLAILLIFMSVLGYVSILI